METQKKFKIIAFALVELFLLYQVYGETGFWTALTFAVILAFLHVLIEIVRKLSDSRSELSKTNTAKPAEGEMPKIPKELVNRIKTLSKPAN